MRMVDNGLLRKTDKRMRTDDDDLAEGMIRSYPFVRFAVGNPLLILFLLTACAAPIPSHQSPPTNTQFPAPSPQPPTGLLYTNPSPRDA
jgi:hypothetical protein